jgi:hypothetical protein
MGRKRRPDFFAGSKPVCCENNKAFSMAVECLDSD